MTSITPIRLFYWMQYLFRPNILLMLEMLEIPLKGHIFNLAFLNTWYCRVAEIGRVGE